MTKVAAIIPSLYKVDAPYLKLCVESLRSTVDWDIIVVTNGTRVAENLDIKGITNRMHTSDQGQCNAVNIGVQVVAPDTDYIFVVNSDMYFAPDWHTNLRFADLCFSPNLVEPTDNAGSAPPFLKFNGGLTLDSFDRAAVDKFIRSITVANSQVLTDKSVRKDYTEPGFNFPFFLRKDIWQTIGGYDVGYDPWGSNGDTDLQTKIELAGIKPRRLRDVLVYHFSNKSGTFDGTHQDFWQHNWDYYTQKWGFNRDDTKGDPWFCKNMIDYEKLKYKPEWTGKYKND